MRLAFLSDVHGNEVALDAVLDDLKSFGVDRIISLGDVASLGPSPIAALRTLVSSGCDLILGNHDEFLLEPNKARAYTKIPVILDSVDWAARQLEDEDTQALATFTESRELDVDGVKICCFHGSSRSMTDDILATTPGDSIDEMFPEGYEAAITAVGHTHIPMIRQHRGRLIVNPGSVGMPFESYVGGAAPVVLPRAEYALVTIDNGTISVTLRRLDLDLEALREEVAASECPLREELLKHYEG